MRLISILAATLVVIAAGAQASERRSRRPKPPERHVDACAAYGPGFVKLPGTTTCVRVGGVAAGQVSVGSGAPNLGIK